MSKCKECGAPLKGLMYGVLWAAVMLRKSKKGKEICNKCECGCIKKVKRPKKK